MGVFDAQVYVCPLCMFIVACTVQLVIKGLPVSHVWTGQRDDLEQEMAIFTSGEVIDFYGRVDRAF